MDDYKLERLSRAVGDHPPGARVGVDAETLRELLIEVDLRETEDEADTRFNEEVRAAKAESWQAGREEILYDLQLWLDRLDAPDDDLTANVLQAWITKQSNDA